MDKATRAIVMTAIQELAEKADWKEGVRANEIARQVLAAHPETKDELALAEGTSMVQAYFRTAAKPKDDRQGLLFDAFPAVRSFLPLKGVWADPNQVRLAQWEGFEKRMESQAAKAGERSKATVQEFKAVRRIVRIVRWYGRGDPEITTDQAMKRRAEFLESRKKRRVRTAR